MATLTTGTPVRCTDKPIGRLTAVHSYLLHGDPSPRAALEQHLYDDAGTKTQAQATALVDQVVNGSRVPAGVDVERMVQIGPAAEVLLDHGPRTVAGWSARGRKTSRHAMFGSVSHQVPK